MTYDIASFGMMLGDTVRLHAYEAALRETVRPGSTVIDIGAGTGVMTLLACRFGAARVYAIDPNPLVALVSEAARINGFTDQVVVVHDFSTNFTPEVRADVVVSDLRGILPFWEGHVESVVDARDRLLAPGGALIPAEDTIHVAVVSDRVKYEKLRAPWEQRGYGVDLTSGLHTMLNTWSKHRFGPDQLMSPSAPIYRLDYRCVSEADKSFSAEAGLTIERDGIGHGLGAWFDTKLISGVAFSNAPGAPEALYGRAFFPWLEPVQLRTGYHVQVRLEAWAVTGPHIWCWHTTVVNGEGTIVARFSQSTFKSTPRDERHFARGAGSYKPNRSREVEMDGFVLSQIDGRTDLSEIGRRLRSSFPGVFGEEQEALDYVARCTRRYP